MVWFYPCFFVKKEGICVQKLDYINSLSLWPNIVPNTISLMVTSKYLKVSTNTMRRIEVFMGLYLYKIKRKTNILLISWNVYFYQMSRGKRNFAKTANKWPKSIIPYTIDKSTIGKTFKKVYAISNVNNLFNVN